MVEGNEETAGEKCLVRVLKYGECEHKQYKKKETKEVILYMRIRTVKLHAVPAASVRP